MADATTSQTCRESRTVTSHEPTPTGVPAENASQEGLPAGLVLRPMRPTDRDFAFAVRRAAFRSYVDELSGWDDAHQRQLAYEEFEERTFQIVEEVGTPVGYLCVEREDVRPSRGDRARRRGTGPRHR